jgi:hypothetical protein
MERCPTCNAKYKGSFVCYRCKSDFSAILNVEKEAEFHLTQAKLYIKMGLYDKALEAVDKSSFLLKTEEGAVLKSYIYALKGDFPKIIHKIINSEQSG